MYAIAYTVLDVKMANDNDSFGCEQFWEIGLTSKVIIIISINERQR